MLIRKLFCFTLAEQNEDWGKVLFSLFQLEERKKNCCFIGTLSPDWITGIDGTVEPLSVLLLLSMEQRRSLPLSHRVDILRKKTLEQQLPPLSGCSVPFVSSRKGTKHR